MIIKGILKLAKSYLTTEEVNKFLSATVNEGKTLFLETRYFFTLEVFQGLFN
jgi:hypothetical protein